MSDTSFRREVNLFMLVMYGVGVINRCGRLCPRRKGNWNDRQLGLDGLLHKRNRGRADSHELCRALFYVPEGCIPVPLHAKRLRKYWISITTVIAELGSDLIGTAAVALGFAAYFSVIFGTPYIFNAIGLVLVMSLINMWGIKKSTVLTIIMTSAEVIGLILVIVFGMKYWGSVNYLEMPGGLQGSFLHPR